MPIDAGDQAAGAKGNFLRRKVGEVIGRADDVGGDVRGQRRNADSEHGDDQDDGIGEPGQHVHRVPDGLMKDYCRRRSHGHADERVKRHGERQADGLAEDLVSLGVRVAGEIRDVQGKRRPKTDHAGQRRKEENPELPALRLARIEGRRLGQNRPEPARRAISPAPAGAIRARSAAAP